MSSKFARRRAAAALAAGRSQAQAAREAGVHRATVKRWMEDPEFMALVEEKAPAEQEVVQATKGLADLVPQALQVIEDALAGNQITPAAARVALDVIKTAAALQPKEFGDTSDAMPEWSTLIQELDERNNAGNPRKSA